MPSAGCLDQYAAVAQLDDSPTLDHALSGPNAQQWREAMQEEIATCERMCVWKRTTLPPGRQVVGCRWVLTIKRNAAGEIERFRARLVAQGFSQRPGVDYDEVYAPTHRMTTLRALLAVGAAHDFEIEQLDVRTAYLNAPLEHEIYMKMPPGYSDDEGDAGEVLKLERALYGLKQAGRMWHQKLKETLEEEGFGVAESDDGLYFLFDKKTRVLLLVYVDDMLICGRAEDVRRVKKQVTKHFDVRDMEEASVFLGMLIRRDREARTLHLSQPSLIAELLERTGMTKCAARPVPLPEGTKLTDAGRPMENIKRYQRAVGSLLYLSECTRPDLCYAVRTLARCMAAPTEEQWQLVKGVLRYVAGTRELGLNYGASAGVAGAMAGVPGVLAGPCVPLGFVDASYASGMLDRKSISGCVFMLNGAAVSWDCRKQEVTALSSCEAEYIAAAMAAREALWLRKLMNDLGEPLGRDPMVLWCDNQGAIALVDHPTNHGSTKHIDVRYHFLRDRMKLGQIVVEYVKTSENVADAFTKALGATKFGGFVDELGMS
jgi:hypothetical protein